MSHILKFFNRFLFFFDRSAGGGCNTEIMDTVVEPAPPPAALTETPQAPGTISLAPPEEIAKRDELRSQIHALGFSYLDIESMRGNCPEQVRTQIADYERWFAKHK